MVRSAHPTNRACLIEPVARMRGKRDFYRLRLFLERMQYVDRVFEPRNVN